MSMWRSVLGFVGWQSDECPLAAPVQCSGAINPATGLPMLQGDCSGVDVGGSPFGADLHYETLGGDVFLSLNGGIDGWE